jgi:hypothetical protein
MANQLEQIKQIEKVIDGLISKLKDVNAEVIAISKSTREVTQGFDKVKTPSNLNDSLSKTNENTTKLNALITEQNKIERQLVSTIAKKVLVQSDTNKQLTKEREELKILRREQRNQVKAVSDIAGAYTKLSATNNILIKRYQDLAVRQAKGIQLTEKEERRLTKLGNAIQKNNDILKKTDAEVGRFQRNVGNYASGFDGLGNAINQLTREAPAFANSLQTGFLAISNNLPILFDQLTAITEQNKILRAEGKPTESVFKRLGGAIFSFQTALSLGVTLLTLYGKELVNLIQKAIDGGAKVRNLADQQKILNEAYKEGAKNAASEISQLQLLIAVASDKTKSDETRNKAVNKLIDSSGGLIKEQDRLNILNGEAVEIENKLVKAILNRAIVQQLQAKISEDINKLLDTQIKLSEVQAERNVTVSKTDDAIIRALRNGINVREQDITIKEKGLEVTRRVTEAEINQAIAVREALKLSEQGSFNTRKSNQLDERANELKDEGSVIQKNINNLIKEALKLTDDYTLSLDNNTKSTKSNNTANRDRALLLSEINTQIKNSTDDLAKGFDNLNEDVSLSTEEIENSFKRINEVFTEGAVKAFDKDLLNEALNDLSGTIQFFTGANGKVFSDFFRKITSEGISSFEDIASVAESSFDVIGEIASAFFQANIDRYEQDIEENNLYYDNLLQNQALTDEERGRLEADRRAKEEEIRRKQKREQVKQAQFEKAIQIGQIITNTASAVVKALPNIPLSIAVGAIGAAQLGIALATPIPQFAEGGVMDHDGLMMINDHKSGRLEVVERDGKLLMTDQKNAIVQGKKGDVIHKDAKEYFSKLSDDEILKDVDKHSMIATLQHQNFMIAKLENKKVIDNNRQNTDRIVNAIKKNKPSIKFNQNIDLGKDLDFLNRLNDTL